MLRILFQTVKPKRRHQHSDQDRQSQSRRLQNHRQPQQWSFHETSGQQLFKRGPPGGKEAEVLPRERALCRQALLHAEAVLPTDGPQAGHGAGGDRRRAHEMLGISLWVGNKNGLICDRHLLRLYSKMVWCADNACMYIMMGNTGCDRILYLWKDVKLKEEKEKTTIGMKIREDSEDKSTRVQKITKICSCYVMCGVLCFQGCLHVLSLQNGIGLPINF